MDTYFWWFAATWHVFAGLCALVYVSGRMIDYTVHVLKVHKAVVLFMVDRMRKKRAQERCDD